MDSYEKEQTNGVYAILFASTYICIGCIWIPFLVGILVVSKDSRYSYPFQGLLIELLLSSLVAIIQTLGYCRYTFIVILSTILEVLNRCICWWLVYKDKTEWRTQYQWGIILKTPYIIIFIAYAMLWAEALAKPWMMHYVTQLYKINLEEQFSSLECFSKDDLKKYMRKEISHEELVNTIP